MDTDDLTEMAYQTIVIASKISDYLKVDIGVRSRDYANEDDYLNGVLKFIREIKNDPEDYMDYWNLHDEIDMTSFAKSVGELEKYISRALGTPIKNRGAPPDFG